MAIRRILESAESIPDYQRIIQAYGKDYPLLGARAQLQIGLILKGRGDLESALEELSRVKAQYPDQRAVAAQADMEIADIYLKAGEDPKAINIYRRMIKDYHSERARELLISTLLRTANRLKNSHDYALALPRYKAAREIDHRRVEAHRGIVECYYRTGRIDEAIREYKALVRKNPEDEVALYTLGLAYSYKGSQEEGLLKRSNSLIQEALSKNYRLIYAYLTLSYNYEALEELEAKKKRGILLRAREALSQPLTWLFHTLTFRTRELPKHWYEKAIDALTTAVALNDEKADPQLESLLCLNLANNYYKMGEFGFERAYKYYHKKLEYDSSFASRLQQAIFYQRLGHCGLVVEDFK
ncbi:MAG TPA: tetratricopeptide repeat protein, partial [bacterium (Candidatus Stahlbacteria)]|nr:tetratricopeptide repeat protein [Candidatus Stahlbacteria bacterium]